MEVVQDEKTIASDWVIDLSILSDKELNLNDLWLGIESSSGENVGIILNSCNSYEECKNLMNEFLQLFKKLNVVVIDLNEMNKKIVHRWSNVE
jgi:FtsZ-interacting cell division protein YlmF